MIIAALKLFPPITHATDIKPSYDALAVAFAQQGNAISAQSNYLTFATMGLALVAVLFALGWGYLVKGWAERASREAVRDWMEGPGIQVIADQFARITPSRMDGGPAIQPGLTQEQQEIELRADR